MESPRTRNSALTITSLIFSASVWALLPGLVLSFLDTGYYRQDWVGWLLAMTGLAIVGLLTILFEGKPVRSCARPQRATLAKRARQIAKIQVIALVLITAVLALFGDSIYGLFVEPYDCHYLPLL